MCVIRRMAAVLEPTKQWVLDTRKMLDAAGITEPRAALCDAAGQNLDTRNGRLGGKVFGVSCFRVDVRARGAASRSRR